MGTCSFAAQVLGTHATVSAVWAARINEEHELSARALPLRALREHHAIEHTKHEMTGWALNLRCPDRRDRMPLVVAVQAACRTLFVGCAIESPLFKGYHVVHGNNPVYSWGLLGVNKD